MIKKDITLFSVPLLWVFRNIRLVSRTYNWLLDTFCSKQQNTRSNKTNNRLTAPSVRVIFGSAKIVSRTYNWLLETFCSKQQNTRSDRTTFRTKQQNTRSFWKKTIPFHYLCYCISAIKKTIWQWKLTKQKQNQASADKQPHFTSPPLPLWNAQQPYWHHRSPYWGDWRLYC